jgi:hypothetical protein
MNLQTPASAVDLATVKQRQHGAWGSGDYARIGTTLQIVGETLCEAVDVRSNHRVLNVVPSRRRASMWCSRPSA